MRLHFITADGTRDIDAGGEATLMEAAKDAGIDGIEADCGGSMVCGTCYVILDAADFTALPPPSAMESEILEYVPDPHPMARLTCQLRVADCREGMTFRVPEAQR